MRVGIVGYGFIGRDIVARIGEGDNDLELAFIYNRHPTALDGVAPACRLMDLAGVADHAPDLIVEVAHPMISQQFGAAFLETADYMPLSVTALTDDALRDRLLDTARTHGRTLLLAPGALIGGEALLMRHDSWERVRITFRKHPDNIDFADSPFAADDITGETVLYEGPVRGIAAQYPRNVNTMVTCALVSNGLDTCEARLICDPSLDVAVAELEAWNQDGGYLETIKRQPAVGVSGTEMLDSVWSSIVRWSRGQNTGYELI